MIDNKLKENKDVNGFIFDGFPRTVAQAQALDQLLENNGTAISTMIALEVDNDELTQRLLKRGETSGRPDDQDEQKIRQRIQEYNDKTLPVAKHYEQQNKFYAINGIGQIDTIFGIICEQLDKVA